MNNSILFWILALSVIINLAMAIYSWRNRHLISEQRRTQNELRLKSAALNATANAVMITDSQDKIQWINPAFSRLTGYSETDAIGKTPRILRSDRHDPDFYKTMEETYHIGQVWRGEVINRRKDGTEYIEEQTITPVFDQSGEISNFVAIKQDITGRKRAEASSRESEFKYRTLVEQMPAVLYIDSLDESNADAYAYVSPQIEILLGYPFADWEKDPFFWKKCVHPEDFERATAVTPKTLLHDQVIEEYRMITRDEKVVWVRDHSILVRDINNQPQFVQGFWEDITERKQAEEARAHAERQLRLALKWTQLLYSITRLGISSINLHVLLQEIVQKVSEGLPANRVSLIIFDLDTQNIEYFVRGGPGANGINLSVTFDELMEGLSGWVIDTGKSALSPKNTPDPRESEAVRQRRKKTNCGSILVTPLLYQGRLLGTLTLINQPDEPDFTDRDVELLEAVAGQVTSSIMKISLENNLQHQNDQLAMLHQITFDLLNKKSIDDLLRSIVEQAARFLDAPYCEIMLLEGDELVVKAYTKSLSQLAGDRARRDEAALSWQALDTKKPAIVNDYAHWPNRRDIYDKLDMGAVVVLPILVGGKSIGVLDVSRSGSGNTFDNNEIQTASLYSRLAALALNNAQLQESLRQESIRDPLTGLFNRRFMQETLMKEVSRAGRKSISLVVVMFDLDHLKEINDSYGHDAGDKAILSLSRLIKSKIRTGDTACRYGGDEFTLILTDTKMGLARQRMQELQMELKQQPIQLEENSKIQLTISVGIAEYPTHGLTGQELIKSADGALYQAKQGGRNQVMTA